MQEIYKKSGVLLGLIYKNCLLLLYLAVVRAVFVVAMSKSNWKQFQSQTYTCSLHLVSENS